MSPIEIMSHDFLFDSKGRANGVAHAPPLNADGQSGTTTEFRRNVRRYTDAEGGRVQLLLGGTFMHKPCITAANLFFKEVIRVQAFQLVRGYQIYADVVVNNQLA
jgi:hypothetical protein